MEADGGGVLPIPSQTASFPPHDDDRPDFSPVGSPESHFIDDLSQPSDQLHAQVTATVLTDDLRNKIVKQVPFLIVFSFGFGLFHQLTKWGFSFLGEFLSFRVIC